MPFALQTIVTALALFIGMLLLMELGARRGRKRLAEDPEGVRAGMGAAEGAVFALLGLLIAFTFTGAMQRYDARRAQIIEESNAIGTAWLRLDLIAAPARTELRQQFRDYVDARLSVYQASDESTVVNALKRVGELQQKLWVTAVPACKVEGQPAVILLLPAMNTMFDIASARTAIVEYHPPDLVFLLLIAMALACALLAGVGMALSKLTNWTHRLAFAGVISLAVYAIQDLEYPRHGLVRLDEFDHVLVDLRAGMK